jgi:hypothetical protein
MRIVERPVFKPLHCAAVPHIGQTADVRWIDTGAELPGFDNHVYLSSKAVEEASRLLSMPTQREFDDMADELDAARSERDELRERVAALEKYEAAILSAVAAEAEPQAA